MESIPNYSPDTIAECMFHMVDTYLEKTELKKLAERCIFYKQSEGFSFSRLTQFHFHMDPGPKHDGMYHVSAAVELLILALDILDDLQDMDGDDKPWFDSPHAASMNLSTGFLMISMQMIQQAPFHHDHSFLALQSLHKQVIDAVNGQHSDLQHLSASEEDFLTMIKSKSGSLMACASMLGAAFHHASDLSTIRLYSESFGVAAQLANDLQDLLRFDTKNDLINKKWTLPIFMLMKEEGTEAGWIRDFYENRVDQAFIADRKQILSKWISQSNTIPYIQILIRIHQRKAIQQLEKLQARTEWKKQMGQLFEQV